jgi:hypothetical protein
VIYYLCSDYDTPAGGIRSIYRHVDILRRNGLEAFVVHERPGFRCTWFENETPVLSWSGRRGYELPRPADRPFLQLVEPPGFTSSPAAVVVVPEIYGPHIPDIAPGVPKVILNQGVYLTFRLYSPDVRELERRVPPFRHPDVVAIIVKTHDACEYLRFAFPRARVFRVPNGIDPALFHVEEPKEALDRLHATPERRRRPSGAIDPRVPRGIT